MVDTQQVIPGAASLDALGVHYGSSLSSLERDLLSSWEEQVVPRYTPGLQILQIGVGNGGSVRTWAAWFADAVVLGLDVRKVAIGDLPANVGIVHGDQTDAILVGNLCRQRQFDLVIDDGSAEPEHKLQTFLSVFPWLAPEARYICVDPESLDAFGADRDWQQMEEVPATAIGAWFGQLGAALVSRVRPVPPARSQLEMVVHRAKCVTCCPGSVVVQARR